MDWGTVIAVVVAALSVLAGAWRDDGLLAARHAFALLLPLAVIAYPQWLASGFRLSFRGFAHGGEGPAPDAMLRVAAGLLLITLVVIFHWLGAG